MKKNKPLTKEEFLDKKNSDLLREVKDVFQNKQDNDAISRWYAEVSKVNKHGLHCHFGGKPSCLHHNVRYRYQAVFINMVNAFIKGDLIIKPTNEEKTL